MKTENTTKQQQKEHCQPFIFDGSAAALAAAERLRRLTHFAPRNSARHGRYTKVTYAVTVYEDSRHVLTKARFSGGGHGTFVKERRPDGTSLDQMMTIANADGDVSVIELGRN